jgi:uncharacterized membrane protein YqaE (UPF0057 family)
MQLAMLLQNEAAWFSFFRLPHELTTSYVRFAFPSTVALTCGDLLKFVCAVFLPPLGVFLEVGCNKGELLLCWIVCPALLVSKTLMSLSANSDRYYCSPLLCVSILQISRSTAS